MLTDYHLHLRTDEVGRAADAFTHENVDRYLAAAEEQGIEELGVSEHIYRFGESLRLWKHPYWLSQAVDDLGAYCDFVRTTPLRLGIEADYIRGAEDRTAALLAEHGFDYVIGSIHYLGDLGAVDDQRYDVWESFSDADSLWRSYFEWQAELVRSGLFDIVSHPDLIKIWGDARPAPERDPRFHYEPFVQAVADTGIAVEISTAGLRKPVEEIYPSRALAEMCIEAGADFALSSDAHSPDQVGFGYEQAIEFLGDLGVDRICVFEGRERRLEPLGLAGTDPSGVAGGDEVEGLMGLRVGIGYDSHRLEEGARLIVGGVEIEHERGLVGHSDADVLAHAITDAVLGASGLGDIGQLFPPDEERWRDADSIDMLRVALAQVGGAILNVDVTLICEEPKLEPHKPEISARLGEVLSAPVNVKASTNEGMGAIGRGGDRLHRGRAD